MKHTILIPLLAAIALLPSCATRSDSTFMENAGAAMHGGMIASPAGVMFSPGIDNRNRPHPFFGAQ
jgi:hypothetical protein